MYLIYIQKGTEIQLHLKILGSLGIVICREAFCSFWEFKKMLYPLNVYSSILLIQMYKIVGSNVPSGLNFVLKDPNQNQWWHCLEEIWYSAICTSALIFENILSWPSVFISCFFGSRILQILRIHQSISIVVSQGKFPKCDWRHFHGKRRAAYLLAMGLRKCYLCHHLWRFT